MNSCIRFDAASSPNSDEPALDPVTDVIVAVRLPRVDELARPERTDHGRIGKGGAPESVLVRKVCFTTFQNLAFLVCSVDGK